MSRTGASSFTAPTSVPSGTSAHVAPGRSATHQKVIVVPFAVARTPPGATFAATAAASSVGTGSECLTPLRPAAWASASESTRTITALVREGPEERRPLVRIAPLGAQRRAAELVLIGGAHLRAIDFRQRIEPLLVAAARVVLEMFLHRQLHRIGGD